MTVLSEADIVMSMLCSYNKCSEIYSLNSLETEADLCAKYPNANTNPGVHKLYYVLVSLQAKFELLIFTKRAIN